VSPGSACRGRTFRKSRIYMGLLISVGRRLRGLRRRMWVEPVARGCHSDDCVGHLTVLLIAWLPCVGEA
jgi:hypothetical protein